MNDEQREARQWERLWSLVDLTGPGCWEWQGAKSPEGYGWIWMRRRMRHASRVVLEHVLGQELDPKIFACHLCDNPSCCRPSHLYAGSHADNMRDAKVRGRMYNKQACDKGHLFTPENSKFHTDKQGYRIRNCRTCANEQKRRSRALKAQK